MTNVTLQKNVLVWGESVMIPKQGRHKDLPVMLKSVNSIFVRCADRMLKKHLKTLEAIGFVVKGDRPSDRGGECDESTFVMERI